MQATRIQGERVAYRVLPGASPAGGTAPLVGLHGLGSDHRDLEEVARRSGAPAVLLDLPGFGASSRPERGYSIRRAARVARALLDVLGVERAVWLGCSYGGHVALRAALEAPERVAALVLVDAGGLDPDPPGCLAEAFDERVLARRTLEQVGKSVDALVARPSAATRRFRTRRLVEHASDPAAYRGVAASAQGALEDDAARHLEAVRAPVELVHGALDALVPAHLAEAAAERLPDAELTILPGAGHMPWLEAPERVAARVRRALARVSPTSTD